MQKKVVSVVGARPNFMKIAPLDQEFRKHDSIRHLVVHTGQHYDRVLSDVFFEQLGLGEPDRRLGVGSGGHGEMTGKIMIEFEKVCQDLRPDMVVVVGDVNSTIAAALTARKLLIPVAHVEAGLRSFDETMPEEINRRLTDCLANLLFVSEPSGVDNLRREGVEMSRVHLVGDIMLETLQLFLPHIKGGKRWESHDLAEKSYAIATIHRPSNVDDPRALGEVIDILSIIPVPTLFPIHPRTLGRLKEFDLMDRINGVPNLRLVAPEPYLEFLSLLSGAAMILSDSGSVQSEASFFDVPCLVCRENTERPIYIESGTCELVGRDVTIVRGILDEIDRQSFKKSSPIVRELGFDVSRKTVEKIIHYLN